MAVAAGADVSSPDWLCCFQYELGLTGRFNDQEEWWWGDEASMEGKGTPLHYAAMINNIEAAEYLLQNGANYDLDWSIAMCPCEVRWHRSAYEQTRSYVPLHTAACHGNLEVAQILLEHGASTHRGSISDWDNTLLHTLAGKGPNRLAMIDFVARQPGVDINELDGNGETPLEEAISKPNNGDIIVKLVQLGAKVQFDSDYNFVEYCMKNRYLENALALLEADVYGHDHIRPIVDGLFCAMVDPQAVWGSYNRVLEMPEELIKKIVHIMIEKYGLDINIPLGDSGHTPLNFIINLGNRTKLNFIVTLLINLGARLDVADQLDHNALVACLWVKSMSDRDDKMRQACDGIIPLLIKASWHQNIDMNAKYTWNGKRRTLFKVLRHNFSEWQPAKDSPSKVLWRSLYASTFNEDNDTTAAYFSERIIP